MQHTDATVTPMELHARTDTSLLAHYRTLIALRNAQPALTFGGLDPVETPDERMVAFVRSHDSGSLLVVHNVGAEPIEVPIPGRERSFREVLYRSHANARVTATGVSLPAHRSLVLRR